VKLIREMIPVKGCQVFTVVTTRQCAYRMPMSSASGIAAILGKFLACSSKGDGFNPERKLLPGSTVVVEVEETG